MLLFTENTCKKLIKKKATLLAEMAELNKKEKEAMRKEVEAVCNAEAAWLAAEKAARKEVMKRKKTCGGGVGSQCGGHRLKTN